MLIGYEEGVAHAADRHGLRHIPDVAVNEFDTPLVSDIFNQAEAAASYDILCYVNTDIVLLSAPLHRCGTLDTSAILPVLRR